jgi:long-chain acyl-CoA synthetase
MPTTPDSAESGAALDEVRLRGPGMFDAYYDPWQPRDEVLLDGWFRTGDLGQFDDAGCLWLRGRCKEVINVLGMKFFPEEVEEVLRHHPAIQEAVVFAMPDRRLGEVSHALAVLAAGCAEPELAEVQAFVGERLAAYKVPRAVRFVDHSPRTSSAKLICRVPTEGDRS